MSSLVASAMTVLSTLRASGWAPSSRNATVPLRGLTCADAPMKLDVDAMKFPSPLLRGRLVKRYKRFLADVVLDSGETVTATCPNTGSMIGLLEPGAVVWLSRERQPDAQVPHTWELVEARSRRGPRARRHQHQPSQQARRRGDRGRPASRSSRAIATLRREVKYGRNSRIDILLEDPDKGLVLRRDQERAPDAPARPRRVPRQRHRARRQAPGRDDATWWRPGIGRSCCT